VESVNEYNHQNNDCEDLDKYIKSKQSKAKLKLDDKIKKIRQHHSKQVTFIHSIDKI